MITNDKIKKSSLIVIIILTITLLPVSVMAAIKMIRFRSKANTIPITPPISIPITSIETYSKSDMNKDGNVDILDIHIFKKMFGGNDCAINIIGNCILDIFDFNQIIKDFGKK